MLCVYLWFLGLLSAAAADIVSVADSEYDRTVLLTDAASNTHVAVDQTGTVLYRNMANKLLAWKPGAYPFIVSGVPASVWDVGVDHSGVVWLGTSDGIYTFDSRTSTGSYVMAKGFSFAKLTVAPNGKIYATESKFELYLLENNKLVRIPGKISRIAFNRDGDLFYTETGDIPVYKRIGGPAGTTSFQLKGLPKTWCHVLEVDRRNDNLYIGTNNGLYYLPPGYVTVTHVQGFGAAVSGFGISAYGDIYIGTNGVMMKLIYRISSRDVLSYLQKQEVSLAKIENKQELLNKELKQMTKYFNATINDLISSCKH